MDERDLAHESDLRQRELEALMLDCEGEEPVPCEPWPLEDLDF
ncbi:MAG: hypothetical protein RJA99_3204 [Pseudomonadota bacterium]|jgi:hypothetical protein